MPDVKSTAEFGMPFTLKGTSELVDVGKEMGHLLGQHAAVDQAQLLASLNIGAGAIIP